MGKIKPYFHSIDLLRGITALFVCLYHFINHHDGKGFLFEETETIRAQSYILIDSVYIFFMISGFVIPLAMMRQNFEIKKIFHFLLRRWVRIEIPYLVSIIAILFIGLLWSLRGGAPISIDNMQLVHHFFYTAGIFEVQWLNPIYWTLAIEFQFYIFIALIFPIINSKNDWIRYGGIFLLSGISFWLTDPRFVFAYFPLFISGLLYLYYISEEKNKNLNLILFILILIQTAYLFSWITSVYILSAVLIVEFLNLKKQNPLVRFGKMGYSFYLMHGIFGGTFIFFMRDYISNPYLLLVLAIPIAITLSFAFYWIIERPSQKLSKKINYSK